MKIFGERPTPSEDCIVLPMGNGDVEIRARAAADPAQFEKAVPEPKPPTIVRPGGVKSVDLEDRDYLKLLGDRNKLYGYWVILESLKPTEGLEWETVKEGDPTTWSNVEKELIETFGVQGYRHIMELINGVNLLSEDKMLEAKKRFLASKGEMRQNQFSRNTEQNSTPSGGAVND